MGMTFRYQPPAVDAGVLVHGLIKAAETAGAEALLTASQQLVPVDTGELKASGHVEHGADGAAVIYEREGSDGYAVAIRMHEDETVNHPNGGQAHYLGDPMVTEREAILAAMAAAVRI